MFTDAGFISIIRGQELRHEYTLFQIVDSKMAFRETGSTWFYFLVRTINSSLMKGLTLKNRNEGDECIS